MNLYSRELSNLRSKTYQHEYCADFIKFKKLIENIHNKVLKIQSNSTTSDILVAYEASLVISEFLLENDFIKVDEDEILVEDDDSVNLLWTYLFLNSDRNNSTELNDHRSRRLPPITNQYLLSCSKILQLDTLLLKFIFQSPKSVIDLWIPEFLSSIESTYSYFERVQVCHHITLSLIVHMINNYKDDAEYNNAIVDLVIKSLASRSDSSTVQSARLKGLMIYSTLKTMDVVLDSFSNSFIIETNRESYPDSSLDYCLEKVLVFLINCLENELKRVSTNCFMTWHEIDVKDPKGICLDYSLQNLISHLGHEVNQKATEKNISENQTFIILKCFVSERSDPEDEVANLNTDSLAVLLLNDENDKLLKNFPYVLRMFLSKEDAEAHQSYTAILEKYRSALSHKELVLVIQAFEKQINLNGKDTFVEDYIENVLKDRNLNALIKIIIELRTFIGCGYTLSQRKNSSNTFHNDSEDFLEEISREIIVNTFVLSKMLKEALASKVKLNKHIQKLLIKKVLVTFKFLLPIKYELQEALYNYLDKLESSNLPIQYSTTKTVIYFIESLCDINFFEPVTVLNCLILPHLFDYKISGKSFALFLLFTRLLKKKYFSKPQLNSLWTLYVYAFYRLKYFCLLHNFNTIALDLIQSETHVMLKFFQ